MKSTKSKPVRIFVHDEAVLDLLAHLRRQSRAEVIHDALAEYLANHREELSRIHAATQQALAAGDIDQLLQTREHRDR